MRVRQVAQSTKARLRRQLKGAKGHEVASEGRAEVMKDGAGAAVDESSTGDVKTTTGRRRSGRTAKKGKA